MLSSGELLPWTRCWLSCHLGARTRDRAPQNTLGFGTPALLPAAEGCQHLQQHCKQILTRRNARSKTATGGAQLGASVPPHSAAPCSNLAHVRQHFQPSTFHPGHLLYFHPMLPNSSSTALHETFKLLRVHLPAPNTGRPHHRSSQDMQQGETATQQGPF